MIDNNFDKCSTFLYITRACCTNNEITENSKVVLFFRNIATKLSHSQSNRKTGTGKHIEFKL